jgi:hypothetical protein
MTLKVHGKLVPNTVLRFPSRTDDETWAVKAETALPAAATVVAIAEEAQGRAASKRASERAKEAMMDGQGQSPREGRAGATT